MIWQIVCANGDLAELSVDSVPVIWQNCLYVEECASDLADLPVFAQWCASDLA